MKIIETKAYVQKQRYFIAPWLSSPVLCQYSSLLQWLIPVFFQQISRYEIDFLSISRTICTAHSPHSSFSHVHPSPG